MTHHRLKTERRPWEGAWRFLHRGDAILLVEIQRLLITEKIGSSGWVMVPQQTWIVNKCAAMNLKHEDRQLRHGISSRTERNKCKDVKDDSRTELLPTAVKAQQNTKSAMMRNR